MRALYRFWLLPIWCCTVAFPGCPDPDRIFEAYGFTTLRPPSRLLRVGTMVAVENKAPFQAVIVCSAEASLGHDVHPVRSPTASGTLHYLQGYKTSMSAQAMSALQQSSKYEALQDVTFVLKDPVIYELTDEIVFEGMMYRTDQCRRALRQRVAAGYTVTMISSVLEAEAEVSAKWSQKHEQTMSESDKLQALKDLTAQLGAESTQSAQMQLNASNLVWALKESEYLAALSQDDLDESEYVAAPKHLPPKLSVGVAP